MAATGSAFQGFHPHHLTCSGGAQAGDKVKFTVSVHGHQWSSARHLHETLQEFARVIERNAKRLDFIGQFDSIQRLQLVKPDGSEPEELDVDATLEDVLICMGDKHLVAMITSGTKDYMQSGTAVLTATATDERPSSPCQLELQQATSLKSFFPKNETPSSYNITPTSAPAAEDDSPTPGCSKSSPHYDVKALKTCDYPSPSGFPDESTQTAVPKSIYYSPAGLMSVPPGGNSTPSPAELAQYLIRGSSNRALANGTSSRLGQLPMLPSAGAFQPSRPFQAIPPPCTQQGVPNIALLAQFLAAQLRAFTPAPSGSQDTAVQAAPLVNHGNLASTPQQIGDPSLQSSKKHEIAGTRAVKPHKEPNDEKDASSSSANVNNAGFPCSSTGLNDINDPSKGRSELVFLVNRRSKMGVGTHHLKMSDLSAYFHLSIVDAAKKLGVSQTTLKKACRKFGLKRWPGRKVRSLESTIHGLEHTIAVGQGAGMEDLTEAYMRSEVLKLQQEMDQLVHGVPAAQHLPMVRTADLYKRLYSRGWRSKFHSPGGGRFDIDLNSNTKEEENNKVKNNVQDSAWETRHEPHVNDQRINSDVTQSTTQRSPTQEQQEETQNALEERTTKKLKVENSF